MTLARSIADAVGVVAEGDPLPPEDRAPQRAPRTLEDLYRSHGAKLRRFFLRRGSDIDADDLVHEAFARYTSRNGQGLDLVAEPEAYLHTVATNLLRNRAKLAVRRAAAHHQSFDDELFASTDPTLLLEDRDALRRVEAALQRLRPRCRQVFLLKRVEGLTYLEIAERTGMSVKGVKKQMAKALFELRLGVGLR